ncbi:hypothetical protein BGZ98_005238, partial [Dissophora globulifera]
MKKTRPNSVSVLPSHQSQFKDKPILGDTGSLSGPAGFVGRLTFRRIVLGAGGLLFVYITISTILGSTPEHMRRGPVASRPESDPYLDIPRDSDSYNNHNDRDIYKGLPPPAEIKLPPIGKEDNTNDVVKKNPWSEPLNNNKPADDLNLGAGGVGSGSRGEVPPVVDNNIITGSEEEEEEESETVQEDLDQSPLAIATRARNNSPATYAELLSASKREFDFAIALVVREADLALKSEKVYSVTNKNQTAPSDDIHDYLSLSKYYWPNPKTSNGLPYIRRDGHINPEIETVEDYRLLRTMIREVHMMGMAYHFTNDKAYLDKCVMRLKEWFLDEETYMNPNINYGSLQKGEKLGARTGVLDMFTIFRVFDALHYLKQDPSWPQDLIPGLQAWFTRYVKWLETALLAKVERKGNNNHGTYFDVQIIGIYLFLGRTDDARAVAQSALTNRIDLQITGKGEQPEELRRKTSWYYSVFNLQALMTLARWGDDLGVDMWHHEGPQGQSIKKAIDFMLPYALTNGEGWPVANIKGFPMGDYLKCLQIAWNIYGDEKYLDAIAQLEPVIRQDMEAGKLKTISTFL